MITPMILMPVSLVLQIILTVFLSGIAWNVSSMLIRYISMKYMMKSLSDKEKKFINSYAEIIDKMESSVINVRKADESLDLSGRHYAPSGQNVETPTEKKLTLDIKPITTHKEEPKAAK